MRLSLTLPDWLEEINHARHRFADAEEAMHFVVHAAEINIADGGGPFGSAVLDENLELVALGANRVIPSAASFLHAEMLALLLAQQRLQTHDLRTAGSFTLISSCAPCAMCLGAIPFAGIARLICGARAEDAEAIHFDEGDKPSQWQRTLERRGIAVELDVARAAAVGILERYRDIGGTIY